MQTTALAKLFPASSSPKVPSTFDPNRECIFTIQKRQKKTARIRSSKITLVLLICGTEWAIPRGKQRKFLELQKRIQKVEFYRRMKFRDVQRKIMAAFCNVEDFDGVFSFLAQQQDGRLSLAEEQTPSGNLLIDTASKHRGNVYLVPTKHEASNVV